MKLLYTPNSPYARKVRIVAIEKHIDMEMVSVVLSAPDCPVNDHNPLGKIPVLIMDDDESLFDSRVIVEYLDNRTPLAHLIPQEQGTKIWVRRWEALADGVCDAAVMAMMESRKPENLQDANVITKQMGKVERGLKVLSEDLAESKWCVNDTFSLADIALGCTLGYLQLRFKEINWQKQYPNLAKHYAELMKRRSFKDTVPPAS
ncbi:MAG TPA: glutathione S-transferase N-terminal domain-containing protein [Methylophilaceae bacterium]|jgi:glutathione S-transferase